MKDIGDPEKGCFGEGVKINVCFFAFIVTPIQIPSIFCVPLFITIYYGSDEPRMTDQTIVLLLLLLQQGGIR